MHYRVGVFIMCLNKKKQRILDNLQDRLFVYLNLLYSFNFIQILIWQHRIYTWCGCLWLNSNTPNHSVFGVSLMHLGHAEKKRTTPISRWKLPSVTTHKALTQHNYLRNAIRRRSSTRRKLKGAVERERFQAFYGKTITYNLALMEDELKKKKS